MPHKPKPNIRSGYTLPEQILDNSRAETRLQATVNKSNQSYLGKTSGWIIGANYPNSCYKYGAKDFQSGLLVTLFDEEDNCISKQEAEKMGSSLARERTIGITIKKINDGLGGS